MKKFLFIFVFFLTQCGYQPLYSSKDQKDFSFKEISLIGEKNLNRRIISATKINKNTQNFSNKKLTLESRKIISETSKNSKGQTESFKMILEIRLKIEDKQTTQKEKIFVKEFSYKNLENKFDLSEYETNIENNLMNQIVEEMIIYLSV